MDYTTLGIGVVAIALGILTAVSRNKNAAGSKKLQAMQKFWGEKNGSLIHAVAYIIMPIVIGIIFIVSSL